MEPVVSRITWLVALVVAIAMVSTLVYRGSYAALSATTSNPGNSWSVFGISLSDNDSGTAMFTASDMVPGTTDARCITVTNDGSGAPDGVRLYADVTGTDSSGSGEGELADEITVVVDYDDTAGIPADCTGFTSDGTLANGVTLGSLEGDYTTGTQLATSGDWQPAAGESRTFQIEYTLPLDAAASVQGDSADATFIWEAQKS